MTVVSQMEVLEVFMIGETLRKKETAKRLGVPDKQPVGERRYYLQRPLSRLKNCGKSRIL